MTAGARKTYVLDTNILLYDPQAVFVFGDNYVVVPIVVIEELDQFKKDLSETGRNARFVSRALDKLREQQALSEGVALPNGGTLTVDLCQVDPSIFHNLPNLEKHQTDNIILAVAKQYEQRKDGPVVVVSKDVNVRIKANALGLVAEDYEFSKVAIEELYTGGAERSVPSELIDALFDQGSVALEDEAFHPNQCVTLVAQHNDSQSALTRVADDGRTLRHVHRIKQGVWGLHPRNREQTYAMDLLLDDSIKLVTLVGKAGTGKTLLAIAAGLHKVAEDEAYHRLLVSRPVYPLGRDIGFLPGDLEEKLNPWMKPIYDAIEFLIDANRGRGRDVPRGHNDLKNLGLMEIEPLTYIRGRSIPHQFLVLDEAQNLTPHEVKTIITRAGEGTKIVLTGDPYQIDNPYVDSASNGLSYVVETFKGQRIAGHMTLVKGERSELAETAANLM
jgi:PhoH-like ATPase